MAGEQGTALASRRRARLGAPALLTWLALLVAAVPFVLLLLLVMDRWAPLLELDVEARDAVHGFARDHGGFVALMRLISWSGSTAAWFTVFGVVALLLLRRGRVRLAVFAVVTVVGSSLLNSAVKAAVGRARPVFADPITQAGGWSFPSGHAQAAVVGYAVLVLLVVLVSPSPSSPSSPVTPSPPAAGRRRFLVHVLAPVTAMVMVLAIGFSRIALGVHFVSDVLAGYLLGVAWLLVMIAAFHSVTAARPVRR